MAVAAHQAIAMIYPHLAASQGIQDVFGCVIDLAGMGQHLFHFLSGRRHVPVIHSDHFAGSHAQHGRLGRDRFTGGRVEVDALMYPIAVGPRCSGKTEVEI